MNFIRSINWVITDKCNCKCLHCDIWKAELKKSVLIEEVREVLNSHLIQKSYMYYNKALDVALGGGEPFLEANLQKIVDEIENNLRNSFKTISTNGLLTEKIIEFVKFNNHLNFKLNISIDGIGRIHDEIRGYRGAFDKVIQTITKIKQLNLQQKIEIKFTLLPQNYDQIAKVYKLSDELGCDFSFKPAENIKNYTNKVRDININFSKEQLCIIRNQAFKISDIMYKKGSFKKAKFFTDIVFYLFSKIKKNNCSVLDKDITITPDGKVFSCLLMPPLGNIKTTPLEKICLNNKKDKITCPSCMLMCGSYKDYTEGYYKSKVANIETTVRCNLNCDICTQKELRKNKFKDMSLRTFKRIISSHPDIGHISFVGGEPFLNKNFFKMTAFLDSKSKTYEITTNGTLINSKSIEILIDSAGLKKLNFSLDGLKEYHDKERGKCAFEKCTNAMKLVNSYLNTSVCTVMRDDNLSEILKLTQFLINAGVKNQKIIYGMNLKKNARIESKKLLHILKVQGPYFNECLKDYNQVIRFIGKLQENLKTAKINIEFEPPIIRKSPQLFIKSLVPRDSVICKQLKQYRFNSLGKRIICEFIRNEFDSRIIEYLNNNLLPICQNCCKLDVKL